LEGLGVNKYVYLKAIGLEGVDSIHLAQGRDKWWTVVSKVMNLLVPRNAAYFMTQLEKY
jgi:hypothetical protein